MSHEENKAGELRRDESEKEPNVKDRKEERLECFVFLKEYLKK